MESRVDLPQPDGPAMATYSPLRMSMWMPERACVSTSSVRNTLVTPSSLIRDSAVEAMVDFDFRFEISEGGARMGSDRGSALGRIGVSREKGGEQGEDKGEREHGRMRFGEEARG